MEIFYVALGSSMGLALWVWVGGGLLKQVLYFFGHEPSLGRNLRSCTCLQVVSLSRRVYDFRLHITLCFLIRLP